MHRLAIIGGGLAGLHLADRLQDKADVTVIEKSRGVSGRLATRRLGVHEFDHGAQYFTARSEAFREFLSPRIDAGVVQPWLPRVLTLVPGGKAYRRDWFEPHYVAVPGMTALCKAMAQSLDVRLDTGITGITPAAGPPRNAWCLQSGDGPLPERFDWVISTAPLPQTHALFTGLAAIDGLCAPPGDRQAIVSPCDTLMLGYEALPSPGFDAARVKHSAIDWIALNHTKPGRSAHPALVVQSTQAWAGQHRDAPDSRVQELLCRELSRVLDKPLPGPAAISLQRWRYAKTAAPVAADYFLDADMRLAACGDGFRESRVEGAFLSAHRLADALAQHL